MQCMADLLGRHMDDPVVESVFERFDFKISIADENGEEPLEWAATSYSMGMEFAIESDGVISTCFFYLKGDDEFHPFQGQMLHDLDRLFSRHEVRRALGSPTSFNLRAGTFLNLRIGPWDRYDDEISLHFEYDDDGSHIEMITAMLLSRSPKEL